MKADNNNRQSEWDGNLGRVYAVSWTLPTIEMKRWKGGETKCVKWSTTAGSEVNDVKKYTSKIPTNLAKSFPYVDAKTWSGMHRSPEHVTST